MSYYLLLISDKAMAVTTFNKNVTNDIWKYNNWQKVIQIWYLQFLLLYAYILSGMPQKLNSLEFENVW